ncbi:MAG: hypothetical protein M5U28_08110 [Sandaracinaceae bacterium]|nr:hypothetical protein [Sandaracinaceae bacterium]
MSGNDTIYLGRHGQNLAACLNGSILFLKDMTANEGPGIYNLNADSFFCAGAGSDSVEIVEANTACGAQTLLPITYLSDDGTEYFSIALYGEGGNDTLRDGTGEDFLCGGDGVDYLYATNGTNVDHLDGDGGNDTLIASGGGDYMYGGADRDEMRASTGTGGLDRLLGGAGDDCLDDNQSGSLYIYGETGTDYSPVDGYPGVYVDGWTSGCGSWN